MSHAANNNEFVNLIAGEISSGIDRALGFWLGRIELELIDGSFTIAQRLAAIEAIVHEYKQCSGQEELASA
jgi:hypothetical protein